MGATVISCQAQQFDPQEAIVLVLLSESHVSIHTYPEEGFAALDCYTCGRTIDPMVAMKYMLRVLQPRKIFSKVLKRGDGPVEVVRPKDIAMEPISV